MPTMRQIITDALTLINAEGVGESASAADAVLGLSRLNALFDDWNAIRHGVYAASFDTYTLVPNLLPHTIGPTGTFVVAQRPVSLDGAMLILDTSTPPVQVPMTLRDADWWDAQTVPELESTYPTDVYYQPDWPNGKLFFWPTPQSAYDVELRTRVLLTNPVSLNTDFSLPPGYQNAITLTLAEYLSVPFARPVSAELAVQALQARARVFANNDVTPRIATADFGMQGPTSGNRADFNWLTGSVV